MAPRQHRDSYVPGVTTPLGTFNPFDKAGFARAVEDLDRSKVEAVRQQMRARALTESYYLCKVVLGYDKLRPATHGPLCVFLDSAEDHRRMEQMPRSHFKSTIVTVADSIRQVMRRNWLRNLIVGDTDKNAQKHLQKVKRHLESNALLRWLFPECVWEDPHAQALVWSQTELILPGAQAAHGEASFDAIGAGSGVVSRHYDRIVPDDIIGDDELWSETEMSKTIEWATGLESLFVPPIDDGQMDIPCTFWRTDDVYAFFETFFGHGEDPVVTGPYSFRRGDIHIFRRSVTENDEPIFPEAVSKKFLERLKQVNPERYAAQYANNPYESGVSEFRKEYLRYYFWVVPNEVIGRRAPDGTVEHIPISSLHRMSFCDPHAGGTEGRRFGGTRAAVITTGVQSSTGRIFILDAWLRKAPTNVLISEIIRQNEFWLPDTFHIEANGLQKMIRPWLDERVAHEERLDVPYRPYIPKGDKDSIRRIKGLQPLMRAGQIWFAEGMTELIMEVLAYPRGTKDGLDCLAQGVSLWGVGFDDITEQEIEDFELRVRRQCSVATGY